LTADGKLNPAVKDPEAVWGFGRRICPGRKLATSSLFITIASVLATFEISPAVDKNGRTIEPSGEYGSGMLRFVVLQHLFGISILILFKVPQAF
jgi:hypothetical protein